MQIQILFGNHILGYEKDTDTDRLMMITKVGNMFTFLKVL